MIKIYQLLMTASFISLFIIAGNAQSDSGSAIFPLNPNRSVVFGQDIIINNLPDQNQKNVTLCSAKNGWLYASYTFDSIGYNWFSIFRSKDNGISWKFLVIHRPYYSGVSIKKIDMVVTGDSEDNQTLFFAWKGNDNALHPDFLAVFRYKCEPFKYETYNFFIETSSGHDMALACDNNYNAVNSNPFSVGLLYSTSGIQDSVIFLSSDNGGITFNKRQVLAVTSKKFKKVSLSYGRSLSQNKGQYFAAWEEQDDSTSTIGNIYTAHSDPYFNSPFTTPIKLDDLDPSLTNLCRNPAISCQVNNMDNDSANLSEVVLFEKFNNGSGKYEITGFYNKKASSGKNFNRLNISLTTNYDCQPDINFDPYDSTFMVTYYDSTNQKLPFLTKDLNLNNPDSWNIATSNYNGGFPLATPYPQVNINHGLKQPIFGWVAQRSADKGVALFNAPYIPSNGIAEQPKSDDVKLIGAFPNPCNSNVAISFEMKKTDRLVISLFNLVGKPMGIITDQTFHLGSHTVQYDLSRFSAGTYFYNLTSGSFSSSGKIIVIR